MKKKIGIDIGHGEDTWTVQRSKGIIRNGKEYEEHHFNSKVGVIVEKRLKELGFEVVMAQAPFKNDVPLRTRTNIYNAECCDLVVSIHANAGVPKANGMGIFYWKGSEEGLRFAKQFVKNFQDMTEGIGLWGDGIWESQRGSWTNFHIIRETKMVAVLIEAGFMTNDNDFEHIFGVKKDKFIPQVAEAIVKTVCDFYKVKYEPHKEPEKVIPPVVKGNYKIKAGDTFYSIAHKFKISVTDLLRANPEVNPRALKIGSYIYVPKGKIIEYRIEKGDTLWELARKYKVAVVDIEKVNKGIDPKTLQIGQLVKIPLK